MNKLVLVGRVVRDAVAGATQNGSGYVALTVAVNRDYKNADGTVTADFISVMKSVKTADGAQKFASALKKGTAVIVDASVRTKTVDNPDGTKVTVTNIVANNIEFCPTNVKEATATANATATTTAGSANTSVTEDIPVADDDLPF